MATPTREAEINSDPTVVKKMSTIVETTRMPRFSLSEKVRPRMTSG